MYFLVYTFPSLHLHQQWGILLSEISNTIHSNVDTSWTFPVAKRNIYRNGWWTACHIFPQHADRLILTGAPFIAKIKPNENLIATVKCGIYMIIKHIIPVSVPPESFPQFTEFCLNSPRALTHQTLSTILVPKQMNDLIGVCAGQLDRGNLKDVMELMDALNQL